MPAQIATAVAYTILDYVPDKASALAAAQGYSVLDYIPKESATALAAMVAYSINDSTHSVVIGKAVGYTIIDSQIDQESAPPIYCIIT